MDKHEVFEQLVETLTSDERRQMLARVSQSFSDIAEPIHVAGIGDQFDPAREFQGLSWWQRFWISLVALLQAKPKTEVVTDFLMAAEIDEIREKAGDIMDARHRVFLPKFRDHVAGIAEATSGVKTIFEAVSGPNRARFIVYLAAMRITLEHRELVTLSDREAIAAQSSSSESALKRRVRGAAEEKLNALSLRSRADMMKTVRNVDLLYGLTQYPFRSILECFDSGECSFEYVRRQLDGFASIVVALRDSIDPAALEAVILFAGSDVAEKMTGEELANWVRSGMGRMQAALSELREHSRALHLEKVLRVVHNDLSFEMAPPTGGEDWFLVYRRFFFDRLNWGVEEHRIRRRFHEISVQSTKVLGRLLRPVDGYPEEFHGSPVDCLWSSALMGAFFSTLYDSMRPILKAVLVQGNFYKDGNRGQFNDAYNDLTNFGVEWGKLVSDLGKEGAISALLSGVDDEQQSREVVEQLVERTRKIRSSLIGSITLLSNLMHGILYAKPGSSYDSLSNFGEIGGRRNAELIEEMKSVAEELAAVRNLLSDLAALEDDAQTLNLHVRGG